MGNNFLKTFLLLAASIQATIPPLIDGGGGGIAVSAATTPTDEKALIRFLRSDDYDNQSRPGMVAGPLFSPLPINVTVYIVSAFGLDPLQRTLRVDMYFRQKWTDERLRNPSRPSLMFSGRSPIFELIWTPDTFMPSSRETVTSPEEQFLRLGSSGDVHMSRRVRALIGCKSSTDSDRYPMDSLGCQLEFESYGFSASDIKYYWGPGRGGSEALEMGPDQVQPNGFAVSLGGHEEASAVLSSGAYSRLEAEIHVVRSATRAWMSFYLPTILVLLISWTAFWSGRRTTFTFKLTAHLIAAGLLVFIAIVNGCGQGSVSSSLTSGDSFTLLVGVLLVVQCAVCLMHTDRLEAAMGTACEKMTTNRSHHHRDKGTGGGNEETDAHGRSFVASYTLESVLFPLIFFFGCLFHFLV